VRAAVRRNLGRAANLYEKAAYGDFSKREPTPILETESLKQSRVEVKQSEENFDLMRSRAERAQWGKVRKSLEGVKTGVGILSDIKTSADLPPVFRQGAFFSVLNPILSGKAFTKSFEGIWTKEGAQRIQTAMESDPDYALLKEGGLDFTGYDETLARQEENVRSHVSEKIPIVGHTQRGFIAFLNLQRFLVAKNYLRRLEHTPTKDDYRSIADIVNDGTGRGKINSSWFTEKQNRNLDAGLELARIPSADSVVIVTSMGVLSL
jgi:hypothetical protein